MAYNHKNSGSKIRAMVVALSLILCSGCSMTQEEMSMLGNQMMDVSRSFNASQQQMLRSSSQYRAPSVYVPSTGSSSSYGSSGSDIVRTRINGQWVACRIQGDTAICNN